MTPQGESERDRDATGRPRNARPRDALGRPLPRGSTSAIEPVPDDLTLPLDDVIDVAQRYLDQGLPFHAHEVLEALWKSRPAGERELWHGLAQIAVGLTHAMRGNITGARALLVRGRDRLLGYDGDSHGIDVAGVIAATGSCLDGLDAENPLAPPRLRPRTRASQPPQRA